VRIVDRQDVLIGGRVWRVITGSGHSPEHVCLWQPELKLFISGDQVLPKAQTVTPVCAIEPASDPLSDFLASCWRIMAAIPDDVLVLPSRDIPFVCLHGRLDEIMQVLPGPDFPTAGFIHGRQGILDAYRTGRGFLHLRARCEVEEDERAGRERIIITEIPYQVNKTKLLERIAEMVRLKKVDGITDLRDESDREGMRIVIDLRRDAVAQVVMNQLYTNTQLQTTFGVIMLALVNNEPRVLSLKEALFHYLQHRQEVITRRVRFDLARAREREHILAGLMVAIDHLDAVISLIRIAESPVVARD